MKKILLILVLLASFSPLTVRADEINPDAAWVFLYQFSFEYTNGNLIQSAPYQITTGDALVMTAGNWKLVILSESGEVLRQYFFDASALSSEGIIVPTEYRGVTARILNPKGAIELSIDIRDSRVCNDNAQCEADAGETNRNCSTDCGSVALDVGEDQTATIADQITASGRLGGILLRLSAGIAGLMLLVGIASMLDSRRRP